MIGHPGGGVGVQGGDGPDGQGMQGVFANIVWIVHVLFVAWVVVAPFSRDAFTLVLHLIVMPFIFLHWATNDDTCALTLLERRLRGVDADHSFFHNLVSPVYKIRDEQLRPALWCAALALWLITLSKVIRDPDLVRDVFTTFIDDATVHDGGVGA